MTSPGLSKPQTARVGSFLRSVRRVVAHWRAIVLLLILACVAFLVARSDEFGPVIDGSGGAQLYMNRGIGITGLPIRFGARPEITVLELART